MVATVRAVLKSAQLPFCIALQFTQEQVVIIIVPQSIYYKLQIIMCFINNSRSVGRVLKVGRLWASQWVESIIIGLSTDVPMQLKLAIGNRKRSSV